MFVYIIVNQDSNKIYIGKTVSNNLKSYLRGKINDALSGRYRGDSHLFKSMKKHPSNVWAIFPLISTLKTNEDLCFWEKVLIAEYDSQNPNIGYNICRGGEGHTGRMSEETKAKLRYVGNPVFQRSPEQEILRKASVEKARAEQGGSFLTNASIAKIKTARSVQDESRRIKGCQKWVDEHREEASTRLSHEAHVLGGRAGSREAKQKAARISIQKGSDVKARHVRWHVNRGQVNMACPLCRGGDQSQ